MAQPDIRSCLPPPPPPTRPKSDAQLLQDIISSITINVAAPTSILDGYFYIIQHRLGLGVFRSGVELGMMRAKISYKRFKIPQPLVCSSFHPCSLFLLFYSSLLVLTPPYISFVLTMHCLFALKSWNEYDELRRHIKGRTPLRRLLFTLPQLVISNILVESNLNTILISILSSTERPLSVVPPHSQQWSSLEAARKS